ncbi:unnamed protein product [Alopecurus aequalis]
MVSRRRTSPAAKPLDDDDLLAEILLRLAPKPSSLPRASLVCKRWRSIATDAAFRRRFRAHHRKPPILGVFEECFNEIKFTPLLDPPDRIPPERLSLDLSDNICTWSVLGCRHGCVLLLDPWDKALLVFEPVSGDTHRVLMPPEFVLDGFTEANATVFCAAGDDDHGRHVHGDCHTSPFKVAVVCSGTGSHAEVAIARVYSQETGTWGGLVSSAQPCAAGVTFQTAILSGNVLYWGLYGIGDADEEYGILKFDLDNQSLTVITNTPPAPPVDSQTQVIHRLQVIRAEDAGLGIAVLSYPSFQLWDCVVDLHGVATWVMRRTVDMDTMLGEKAEYTDMAGYAEDADAIVLSMYETPAADGDFSRYDFDPSRRVLFTVHLESMEAEKHHGIFRTGDYHPFANFYTAVKP